ncbi:hypothetical protein ED208_12700 [Stagnimonas aquatica]|uniref:LamG domain-containing protein n=1 Tax=Stagnimonas aquatica TaxID=2689987 RepID=A0A3N0V7U1_9GAMM|nr:hypothetical protein [Stagnimonas aquatica]ROH88672.1 hypothetical protein ED208_12700 [Stagnimonas aquatica]
MQSNFFRLPFGVDFPGASKIAEADASPLAVPGLRANAAVYDQWEFGGDDGSLTGLVNAQALTASGTGITLPTYAANYMTIASGATHGLSPAGITDSNNWTVGGVFRYTQPAEAAVSKMYAVSSTDTAGLGGMAIFDTPTERSIRFLTRGIATTDSVALDADVADGDWIFIAISESADHRIAFVGGHSPVRRDGVKTVRTGGLVSVGNNTYQQANYLTGPAVAAFVIVPAALDADGLQQLYLETRARMKQRGITVF